MTHIKLNQNISISVQEGQQYSPERERKYIANTFKGQQLFALEFASIKSNNIDNIINTNQNSR